MYSVTPTEPKLNDDPQPLFDIEREDGVLVGHFYNFEHAEIACAALNQSIKNKESNNE
ncbi:hypothetical protein MMP61_17365 [Acinetobacter sp. NIPH 1958]|uniref:hypothetical protein n=1 Tax=Acinetobacter sp. NIPH 1958 TaxID=2923430 RepID=UPI001F4ACF2A|nr:hypothetical protein [Acinetobacter sp. NIPH 1958]MCH7357317.1 hypothetical protein [Acinetobacter sp. NIPH 1958]